MSASTLVTTRSGGSESAQAAAAAGSSNIDAGLGRTDRDLSLATRHGPSEEEIPMTSRDVVLCHPVRTAIGAYNGTLKGVPATELGAAAVRETLARAGLAPERVGSVVMG